MFKLRLHTLLLLLNVVCLLCMGTMAIYSTTYTTDDNYYLTHQLMWIGVGIIAASVVALTPMEYLSKVSKLMLMGITLFLVYLVAATYLRKIFGAGVRLPLVVYAKGASRWIGYGGISVQPSEFAKFALILFLSTYYGTRDIQKIEDTKEGLVMPLLVCLVVMSMIVLGKALSNTILCGVIVFSIMFISGVKLRKLLSAIVIIGFCALLCIAAEPYRMKRITNFISHRQTEVEWTTAPRSDDNHQLERSICAIGSGGMFGLGMGRGRLKNKAIPESKTDFIFAVIGEEYGFAGVFAGISLYMLFMVLCFLIGNQCRERRGMLICMSVGLYVAAQAGLNLAVICGLAPTTGVTAPLVSYGGSSIVSVMMCVGLVFNVSRQNIQEYIKEIVVEPADILFAGDLKEAEHED